MTAGTPRFQEKREAILDGAARLFNQHGIKGATLADVASSVGLITNSITYYYRKKEDLAAACLLRSADTVSRLAAGAGAHDRLEDRVAAFVGAFVGMLADIAEGRHPELATFNDVRALTPPHADAVFEAYNGMFRAVRRLLKPDAGGQGVRERDDLNARAHLLLSTTTWTRAWINRYEPADFPRVAAAVADLLLNGLAAPGQPWEPADGRFELVAPGAAQGGTTEAFLRAATRLVNEQGYRGASVDRISAELNLTKGSFYHHHETKEDLVSACFDRTFDVVREAQRRAAETPGTGWQRVVLASTALVRYQLSPQGPLLRMSAWSALPQAMRSDKLRAMSRLGERFAGFIVDGMKDGSIRVLDQSVAAQVVNGMINAAVELERWVAGVTADNAADLYARPVLQGLSHTAG